MCGRFTLALPPEAIAKLLELDRALEAELAEGRTTPRWNIAPGQEILAAVNDPDGRRLKRFRWGLVPGWAEDPAIGNRLVNARAETVAEKPSFRQAFARRRCLIPADGFYEWTAGPHKRPWLFRPLDADGFALAGLWERWGPPGRSPLTTCTIVTTEANDLVGAVHGRMPVIIPPEAYATWLDPDPAPDPSALQALLRPLDPVRMTAHPVSSRVNDPRADDAGLVEVDEGPDEPQASLF